MAEPTLNFMTPFEQMNLSTTKEEDKTVSTPKEYVLNGESISLDTLKNAAQKYNMDFDEYVVAMEKKGLKKKDPEVSEVAPITHASLRALKDYRWRKAEEDISTKLNNLYFPQGFEVGLTKGTGLFDPDPGQDVIEVKNRKTG